MTKFQNEKGKKTLRSLYTTCLCNLYHSKEQYNPLRKKVIIPYLLRRKYKNRFQPNKWQSKWKEYTECLDCKFLSLTLRIWILNFSSRKWHYFGLPPNQIMNIFTGNPQTFKPGSGTSWNKPMNSILISGKLKIIKKQKIGSN